MGPTPNEFIVLPTSTLAPQPTTLAAAHIPAPKPVPPVNIPPAPVPQQARDEAIQPEAIVIVEGSRAQTWTATPTVTPTTPKPSPTPSPSPTATYTVTPSPTASPTATSSPTPSPTSTPTSTATPTHTPLPTATPTFTPLPTSTPTPSPTASPTATLTPTQQPTSTSTKPATTTPHPNTALILKPTALAKLTDTPTPESKPPATPVVVAAALKTDDSGISTEGTSTRPAQPNLAKAANLVDAVALTNSSIGLSWLPAAKIAQYRVYSDMGSGFGVYLYKTEVNEPAFVDKTLRTGRRYRYRVTYTTAGQEMVLAQTEMTTLGSGSAPGVSLTDSRPITNTTIIPAPTALPPDAVILGLMSDNSFTDDFNTLNIVGEVRNDSPMDIGQAHIAVTFYDSTGAVIATADGETLLEVIPPGETAPFLVTVSRPAGFTSYSLRAVGRPVQPKHGAQLAITQVKRFEDEAGFFHIKGTIQNTGSSISERTKVVAIIYGRGNNIINLGFTYVDPPTLAPGEHANYEVIFTYYPKYVSQKVIPFEE